jgi:hypothetical protein
MTQSGEDSRELGALGITFKLPIKSKEIWGISRSIDKKR